MAFPPDLVDSNNTRATYRNFEAKFIGCVKFIVTAMTNICKTSYLWLLLATTIMALVLCHHGPCPLPPWPLAFATLALVLCHHGLCPLPPRPLSFATMAALFATMAALVLCHHGHCPLPPWPLSFATMANVFCPHGPWTSTTTTLIR